MRRFLPIALLCVPAALAAAAQLAVLQKLDTFYLAYAILALAGLPLLAFLWGKRPDDATPGSFPMPGPFVMMLCLMMAAVPMFMVGVAEGWMGKTPEGKATAESLVLATTLAMPIQVAFLAAVQFVLLSPAGFRIGWKRVSYRYGYLAWFAATPCVFAVFLLALEFTQSPDMHAFEKVRQSASGGFLAMMLLQTALLTPIVEEWLFRGVVLRWQCYTDTDPAARLPMPSVTIFLIALMYGGLTGSKAVPAMLFIAATFGFGLAFWSSGWLSRRACLQKEDLFAVAANASLFAAAHGGVWPSPVPLFFLSLVLAWLALRTGGIVAPVVAHALFNAVSCLAPYVG